MRICKKLLTCTELWLVVINLLPEARAEGTLCETHACKAERSAHRPEVEFTVRPVPGLFRDFFDPRSRPRVFGTDSDQNGMLEEIPRSGTDSYRWLSHLGVRAP